MCIVIMIIAAILIMIALGFVLAYIEIKYDIDPTEHTW